MPRIVVANRMTPLAAALRPKSLNEVIGQEHLLGPGKMLRQMADKKSFSSTIFWGPPGVGKTSIVRALALETDSNFKQLNATDATVKEIRAIIAEARQDEKRTMVFVDEIHRFSKSQQDVLLPVVEDGTIILFGATTENPKHAINSTILSRCVVLEVKPLDRKASVQLILRVKEYYKEHGKDVKISKDAAERLITRCSGDARKMITALETVINILSDDGSVTVDFVNEAIPAKHIVFDASGNDHFDMAHCYQEAIQNSDPDGAIYWLAKWISSGEDPAYICRRMMITAFEDCAGNPFAGPIAMAAHYATERTGLPECMIPMALATCEMAMSKRNKSAYYAIKSAMSDVDNNATIHVPPSLRAGTSGYEYAVNKTYLEGWERDWDAIKRHEVADKQPKGESSTVMYAIVRSKDMGGIEGPTSNLKELVRQQSKAGTSIVEYTGTGSNCKCRILYNWDDIEFCWEDA